MDDCFFCQLVSGKIPGFKIFEDNFCVALLDIAPANKGQILLMSKNHYQTLFEVPDNALGNMMNVAKRLCSLLGQTLSYKAFSIVCNVGEEAGQRVPHFLISIVPRSEDDKNKVVVGWNGQKADEKELKDIQEKLHGQISMPEEEEIIIEEPKEEVKQEKPKPSQEKKDNKNLPPIVHVW